jgi:hypothetical protein
VLAAELRAAGPSAPVPLRRDSPAAGVEHAAFRCIVMGSFDLVWIHRLILGTSTCSEYGSTISPRKSIALHKFVRRPLFVPYTKI